MRLKLVPSFIAGLVLILLTAFTGNADFIDPRNVQENASIPAGVLSGANTIGQTFISHADRLHAIDLVVVVSDDLEYSSASRITLHVRQQIDSSFDLATVSVPIQTVANNRLVKFTFSPIDNSQGQSFYFLLDAAQAQITRGYISVWSSEDDAYADGRQYVNGVAVNRDLVFRTYHEPSLPTLFHSFVQTVQKHSFPIMIVLLACVVVCLALVLLTGNYRLFTVRLDGSSYLVIFLLSVLAFSINLLQISNVPVPLWKDSPVHAELITQILATAQIPTGQFYHFGFHVLTAFLVWISGIAMPQMMLVLGQTLLTLTGVTVWLFVRRFTGNNITAVTSAVCVWFLSPTPGYFISWGRYPLVLGGALLPLALYLGIEWTEQSRWNVRIFFSALIVFLGMAFSHVRLSAFYLVFVVIYLIGWGIRNRAKQTIWQTVFRVGVLVILETALVWIWIKSQTLPTGSGSADSPVSSMLLGIDVAIAVLLSQHGGMMMALTGIGIIVLVWRQSASALVVIAWFVILYSIALIPAGWLGSEYLSPAFVLLMAFLPMSIIAGELIAFVYTTTTVSSNKTVVVWSVTLAVVVGLGARDMIALVNPTTIIFSDADQNAMEWISQNTPRDAKFLINSAEWFPASFSPADGGWWIPYTTGRRTDWAISASDAGDAATWIAAHDIEWIYLGWRNGIFKKSEFICQPVRYVLHYHQNGVAILQVRQPNQPISPLPDFCLGN
jgi:hypothetical protein